jgi:hypothetical protein
MNIILVYGGSEAAGKTIFLVMPGLVPGISLNRALP